MFLTLLLSAVAATAPAPAATDLAWETYACEDGPSLRLALVGGRPASEGFLEAASGVVALTRHQGEPQAVLRGEGYMVRPFNWSDILYAPPGHEKSAYQCRVENAAGRPDAPALE